MKTFTEWMTKEMPEESGMVENQLNQLVDKVMGVLFYVDEGKKSELIDKFVENLRERLNEKV